MKNWVEIDVDDMSVEHLRNALKVVIRSKERYEELENECWIGDWDWWEFYKR